MNEENGSNVLKMKARSQKGLGKPRKWRHKKHLLNYASKLYMIDLVLANDCLKSENLKIKEKVGCMHESKCFLLSILFSPGKTC